MSQNNGQSKGQSKESYFDFSFIMLIIIILAFIVVTYYYFWYVKTDISDNVKDISMTVLNEPDITIIDILKKTSKKYPQSIAMKYHNTEISYSEYYDKTYNFAEKLLCNIGPHTRTGIICKNRPETVIAHMGTMMSGGISIGIDDRCDNIGEIVNNSCVDILIIDTYKTFIDLFDIKIPTVKKILYIDIDLMPDQTDEIILIALKNIENNNGHLSITQFNDFVNSAFTQRITIAKESWIPSFNSSINVEFKNPHPDDIAQIIYHNNDDKGNIFTHKNIVSSMKAYLSVIQSKSNICVQQREKFVSHVTSNGSITIAQLVNLYVPIISSGTIFFSTDTNNLLNVLKDAKPSIFITSFDSWQSILTKIKEKQHETQIFLNKLFMDKLIIKEMGLDKTKHCIINVHNKTIDSNTKIKQLVEQFEELGIELCVMYGIKEAMGPISMSIPGSKGRIMPIISIKIDQSTNEISIKGDQLFKEYLQPPSFRTSISTSTSTLLEHIKLEEKIEKTNKNEWLKTGEYGYIDRSGFLFYNQCNLTKIIKCI